MALELNTSQTAPQSTEKSAWSSLRLPVSSKVLPGDRMFLLEQLALLLETGSNLHEALQILRRQIDVPAVQQLIEALIEDISEGRPFSHAMSKHPAVFSNTYVNLVAASEKGGFIHEVLKELLEMERKREELNRTLLSAFSYPIFLIVFSVFVVVFVLVIVFPKFGELFARIEDQLPATTIVLMAASNLLRGYWIYVLGTIGATAILLRQWFASDAGRLWLDSAKLHTPVVKEFFMQLYVVQSMRVMGLSLANGVTVVDTLNGCREVVSNALFRKMILDVEKQVQQGNGIAAGFRHQKIIPSIVRQMIATGEETGSLALVMERVADYYEKSLSKKLAAMARIVEPVMLLVMGVVVGVIVSSLILPIFKLSRAVS